MVTEFTPISALIGGGLIGLAAALMMVLNGRIAGVSGILAGAAGAVGADRHWRIAFVAGLVAAPVLSILAGFGMPPVTMPAWPLIIIGGLLVGFGTRMGSGCTSGHGVCGIARLSPRSIAATATFMAVAILTVTIIRHVIAGAP